MGILVNGRDSNIYFSKSRNPCLTLIILIFMVSLILCNLSFATEASNNTITKQNKDSNEKISASNSYKSALPSKFDLRTQGRVSPVKDQNPAGTCWTFAALGSLESCLLTKEKWSFSENHMKNFCSNLPQYKQGFDRKFNSGGSYYMAMAYLARYSGPVTTKMDPYNPNSGYSPPHLKPVLHFQESIVIAPSQKPGNSALKMAIMKYGAVAIICNGEALQYDAPYYDRKYGSSYFPGSRDPRINQDLHAVCVVGWDDNYDRNKFRIKPPGNGAFIIKNSWGTWFGNKGYGYISYYDVMLLKTTGIVFKGAANPSNYKYIYQYDPFGYIEQWGSNKSVSWFANVFQANKKSKVSAVSFYTISKNTSYKVYVYLNPTKNNPTSGILSKVISGTIGTMGYKTIPLPKYIPLFKNQKFAVVVQIYSREKKPVAYEYPKPKEASRARAQPGQSYVSYDGKQWKDFTKIIKNGNVCLKAFATD